MFCFCLCFAYLLPVFPTIFTAHEARMSAFLVHCCIFSTQQRMWQMVSTQLTLGLNEWVDGSLDIHL